MIIREWSPIFNELPEGRENENCGIEYAELFFHREFMYKIYGWYEEGNPIPLGIGGMAYDGNRADLFMFLSEVIKIHPLQFHRIVKRYFKELIKEYNWINTFYAFVDVQHPERIKWIERFGFIKIGTEKLFNQEWWEFKWERHLQL